MGRGGLRPLTSSSVARGRRRAQRAHAVVGMRLTITHFAAIRAVSVKAPARTVNIEHIRVQRLRDMAAADIKTLQARRTDELRRLNTALQSPGDLARD